jgi:N utilization substance protein B
MTPPTSEAKAQGSARARGRELALWLLCHLEARPAEERAEAAELFWREPPTFPGDEEFFAGVGEQLEATLADSGARRWARRLGDAWLARADEIDGVIEAASERWRLARMDRVDRNVLRLCAVELSGERTPRAVVVSEAVRLAARYGSERSAAFVNGLAEALARRLRDEAEAAPVGEGGGSQA